MDTASAEVPSSASEVLNIPVNVSGILLLPFVFGASFNVFFSYADFSTATRLNSVDSPFPSIDAVNVDYPLGPQSLDFFDFSSFDPYPQGSLPAEDASFNQSLVAADFHVPNSDSVPSLVNDSSPLTDNSGFLGSGAFLEYVDPRSL